MDDILDFEQELEELLQKDEGESSLNGVLGEDDAKLDNRDSESGINLPYSSEIPEKSMSEIDPKDSPTGLMNIDGIASKDSDANEKKNRCGLEEAKETNSPEANASKQKHNGDAKKLNPSVDLKCNEMEPEDPENASKNSVENEKMHRDGLEEAKETNSPKASASKQKQDGEKLNQSVEIALETTQHEKESENASSKLKEMGRNLHVSLTSQLSTDQTNTVIPTKATNSEVLGMQSKDQENDPVTPISTGPYVSAPRTSIVTANETVSSILLNLALKPVQPADAENFAPPPPTMNLEQALLPVTSIQPGKLPPENILNSLISWQGHQRLESNIWTQKPQANISLTDIQGQRQFLPEPRAAIDLRPFLSETAKRDLIAKLHRQNKLQQEVIRFCIIKPDMNSLADAENRCKHLQPDEKVQSLLKRIVEVHSEFKRAYNDALQRYKSETPELMKAIQQILRDYCIPDELFHSEGPLREYQGFLEKVQEALTTDEEKDQFLGAQKIHLQRARPLVKEYQSIKMAKKYHPDISTMIIALPELKLDIEHFTTFLKTMDYLIEWSKWEFKRLVEVKRILQKGSAPAQLAEACTIVNERLKHWLQCLDLQYEQYYANLVSTYSKCEEFEKKLSDSGINSSVNFPKDISAIQSFEQMVVQQTVNKYKQLFMQFQELWNPFPNVEKYSLEGFNEAIKRHTRLENLEGPLVSMLRIEFFEMRYQPGSLILSSSATWSSAVEEVHSPEAEGVRSPYALYIKRMERAITKLWKKKYQLPEKVCFSATETFCESVLNVLEQSPEVSLDTIIDRVKFCFSTVADCSWFQIGKRQEASQTCSSEVYLCSNKGQLLDEGSKQIPMGSNLLAFGINDGDFIWFLQHLGLKGCMDKLQFYLQCCHARMLADQRPIQMDYCFLIPDDSSIFTSVDQSESSQLSLEGDAMNNHGNLSIGADGMTIESDFLTFLEPTASTEVVSEDFIVSQSALGQRELEGPSTSTSVDQSESSQISWGKDAMNKNEASSIGADGMANESAFPASLEQTASTEVANNDIFASQSAQWQRELGGPSISTSMDQSESSHFFGEEDAMNKYEASSIGADGMVHESAFSAFPEQTSSTEVVIDDIFFSQSAQRQRELEGLSISTSVDQSESSQFFGEKDAININEASSIGADGMANESGFPEFVEQTVAAEVANKDFIKSQSSILQRELEGKGAHPAAPSEFVPDSTRGANVPEHLSRAGRLDVATATGVLASPVELEQPSEVTSETVSSEPATLMPTPLPVQQTAPPLHQVEPHQTGTIHKPLEMYMGMDKKKTLKLEVQLLFEERLQNLGTKAPDVSEVIKASTDNENPISLDAFLKKHLDPVEKGEIDIENDFQEQDRLMTAPLLKSDESQEIDFESDESQEIGFDFEEQIIFPRVESTPKFEAWKSDVGPPQSQSSHNNFEGNTKASNVEDGSNVQTNKLHDCLYNNSWNPTASNIDGKGTVQKHDGNSQNANATEEVLHTTTTNDGKCLPNEKFGSLSTDITNSNETLEVGIPMSCSTSKIDAKDNLDNKSFNLPKEIAKSKSKVYARKVHTISMIDGKGFLDEKSKHASVHVKSFSENSPKAQNTNRKSLPDERFGGSPKNILKSDEICEFQIFETHPLSVIDGKYSTHDKSADSSKDITKCNKTANVDTPKAQNILKSDELCELHILETHPLSMIDGKYYPNDKSADSSKDITNCNKTADVDTPKAQKACTNNGKYFPDEQHGDSIKYNINSIKIFTDGKYSLDETSTGTTDGKCFPAEGSDKYTKAVTNLVQNSKVCKSKPMTVHINKRGRNLVIKNRNTDTSSCCYSLQDKDIVTNFNGHENKEGFDMNALVQNIKPGTKLKVKVRRRHTKSKNEAALPKKDEVVNLEEKILMESERYHQVHKLKTKKQKKELKEMDGHKIHQVHSSKTENASKLTRDPLNGIGEKTQKSNNSQNPSTKDIVKGNQGKDADGIQNNGSHKQQAPQTSFQDENLSKQQQHIKKATKYSASMPQGNRSTKSQKSEKQKCPLRESKSSENQEKRKRKEMGSNTDTTDKKFLSAEESGTFSKDITRIRTFFHPPKESFSDSFTESKIEATQPKKNEVVNLEGKTLMESERHQQVNKLKTKKQKKELKEMDEHKVHQVHSSKTENTSKLKRAPLNGIDEKTQKSNNSQNPSTKDIVKGNQGKDADGIQNNGSHKQQAPQTSFQDKRLSKQQQRILNAPKYSASMRQASRSTKCQKSAKRKCPLRESKSSDNQEKGKRKKMGFNTDQAQSQNNNGGGSSRRSNLKTQEQVKRSGENKEKAFAAPVPGAQKTPTSYKRAKRRSFEVGDIVWVKIENYLWWPAQIQKVIAIGRGKKFDAALFCGDDSFEELPLKDLKKYEEYFSKGILIKYHKGRQSPAYMKGIEMALSAFIKQRCLTSEDEIFKVLGGDTPKKKSELMELVCANEAIKLLMCPK